jgi:hypothetical protein
MNRMQFKHEAAIAAMSAILTENPNTSKLFIAKEAVKMAEILSHEMYGEEIKWPIVNDGPIPEPC